MSKPTVFVTRKLPDDVEARLSAAFDVNLQKEGNALTRGEIMAGGAGCAGLVTCPADPMDGEMITALAAQGLKIIATFSVGYEHIDLDAAKAAGVAVTHTPDVLTDATADLALLLILAASRRAREGMEMIQQNTWTGWTPTQLMGQGLQNKRLGLIGMGRIGLAVAERARAFGMEVLYHNRKRAAQEGPATYVAELNALLAQSDVLSLHCPLTEDTRGLLNADRLSRLPKGAIVINTARGPVIEDEALIAAITSGHIAAAGLDVFDGEPSIHPGYRELPQVFALPHLGSATVETRGAMGFRVADNLDAFFAGHTPPHALT